MFSGLSSFVYCPAIRTLTYTLKTLIGLINLTITSYLVVLGVAPSIIGDMADQTGRRPLYIVAFAIYTGANLGLALQSSCSAQLVLRMIQSAGSSGMILQNAMTSGVLQLAIQVPWLLLTALYPI